MWRLALTFLLAFGRFSCIVSRYESFISDSAKFFLPVVYYPMNVSKEALTKTSLIAPPEAWISVYSHHLQRVDKVVINDEPLEDVRFRARYAYLQMLSGMLLGTSFGKAEKTVAPLSNKVVPLNLTLRLNGEDNTYLGTTMIGIKRMENIEHLISKILKEQIEGVFIETGSWRGGASIYARGIFRAYEAKARAVIVCDSFAGLPIGNTSYHKGDIGWSDFNYLRVNDIEVANYFKQYSLLDHQVYFAKGFFNDTMPIVAQRLDHIAILRMDGDMYQSTVDVLYHLYAKISIGGYVIVDDWDGFPAKDAVLQFFRVHKLSPTIVPIDTYSVYWKKDNQVETQYWRYEQKKFI